MAIKIIIHNVVKNDGKILMLKRASNVPNLPNFWDIPGGSLEDGEDLTIGVIRETIEETGIKTTNPEIFHYFANYENSKEMHYITIFFSSDFVSGDVIINPEEHQDYKWINISDIAKFCEDNDTPDYFPSLIKKVLKIS